MTLSEKSWVAATTESETCALALWPLTVAVNVTVAVVAGVEEAAVIVSGEAMPGLADSVDGETLTPLGSPETETVVTPPLAGAPSNREAS